MILLFIPIVFENHLIHLSKVFNILRKYYLKLTIEKCHFCQTEIEALDHKVTTDGLLPLDKRTLSIMNMTPPTNVSELRSFLGMTGYFIEISLTVTLLNLHLFVLC